MDQQLLQRMPYTEWHYMALWEGDKTTTIGLEESELTLGVEICPDLTTDEVDVKRVKHNFSFIYSETCSILLHLLL